MGKGNGLEDCTGKQLVQHVFRTCFEILGNDNQKFVVLATGPQDDVFDDLPPLPSNFVSRRSIPQLELLSRCNVFVTHGGANSMHEALSLGVPMIVIPVFGDQPLNSDAIAACGAGIGFRHPLASVNPSTFAIAMDGILRAASFRAAAMKMSEKLSAAGGVESAVS